MSAAETWATIPDWDEKQHYKKGRGSPPWIKFHTNILSSRRFQTLPLASKALAPQLWLLATKNDGRVNVDIGELEFQLRWPREEIEAGLKGLIEKDYLHFDSKPLADCKQVSAPEERRDRGEVEAEEETEAECAREGDAPAPKKFFSVPITPQPDVSCETTEVLQAWADLEIDVGWKIPPFGNSPPTLPTCSPGDILQIAHLRKRYGDSAWPVVIENIRGSPFYRGNEGSWGGARLGWVLKEENFVRVLRNDHGSAAKHNTIDKLHDAITEGVLAARRL